MALPAACLFDMDGLLLDTERLFLQVALDLTGPRGLDPDATTTFFLSLVGSSSTATRARLIDFLPEDWGIDAFYSEWHGALSQRLEQGVPLKAHVPEVLGALQGKGVRMAVVTSTLGARARHHLTLAGIHDHFEHVLGGDEVTANKPDPAPYLEAAAILGVQEEECCAFEDSDRGIAAAVSAGCRSVQIPDLRPHDVPLPDLGQLVAPDLRQAMERLGIL